MHEELDMVDFNEASDNEKNFTRAKSKENVKEEILNENIKQQNSRNSYFVVYYNKKHVDEIRSTLADKTMKLNKFEFNERELNPALEKSKNIYFLFLEMEKKIIKAIMKKDYIKSDKNLKLETKIK
jgi:hypothetical protein